MNCWILLLLLFSCRNNCGNVGGANEDCDCGCHHHDGDCGYSRETDCERAERKVWEAKEATREAREAVREAREAVRDARDSRDGSCGCERSGSMPSLRGDYNYNYNDYDNDDCGCRN